MSEQQKLLIVEYCLQHKEQMWAAAIMGIIFNCSFRESWEFAEHWLKQTKE
jgi:hypothetical protein